MALIIFVLMKCGYCEKPNSIKKGIRRNV